MTRTFILPKRKGIFVGVTTLLLIIVAAPILMHLNMAARESHAAVAVCNGRARHIDDAVCLQDMNVLIKYTMETGREYELVDMRDGKNYKVAKLDDGNVWLLDNLRIGGDEEMLLTTADTNTNPNMNSGNYVLPASGNWTDSYTESAIDTTDAERMLGSAADKIQGGYYNYCAASAGTYCDEADEATGDAEFDICPAGWRMPTGGNGGEYQIVDDLYSDLINTLHLPLSGRFYGGESGQIDKNGYFWSSTNRDGVRMYYLSRSNQTIAATGSYNRDRGYSMRCVAKDVKPKMSCAGDVGDIENAVCLQDMNVDVRDSMVKEKEYVLVDSRDEKIYRVALLEDGNVWLLDNLRIGGDTEMMLTSRDTNTDPNVNGGNFVLPASGIWSDSYTEPYINTAGAEMIASQNGAKLVGGYYNYCAASAGTYCEAEDAGAENAKADICPVGWRMPTGGDGGEYQVLDGIYGAELINVLHLPLAGRYYSDGVDHFDRDGYFWSSTNRDGARMYYLNRSSSGLDPMGSYNRDRGYSMRCVAKPLERQADDEEEVPDVPNTGANIKNGAYSVESNALAITVLIGLSVVVVSGFILRYML